MSSRNHPQILEDHHGVDRVSSEVSRGEKMALRGTDPESYITQCTSVYEGYSRVFKKSAPIRVKSFGVLESPEARVDVPQLLQVQLIHSLLSSRQKINHQQSTVLDHRKNSLLDYRNCSIT